jgi:hypothetical protein
MIGNSRGESPLLLDCYLSWMSCFSCPAFPERLSFRTRMIVPSCCFGMSVNYNQRVRRVSLVICQKKPIMRQNLSIERSRLVLGSD